MGWHKADKESNYCGAKVEGEGCHCDFEEKSCCRQEEKENKQPLKAMNEWATWRRG
jgi:hypothetical protein